MNNQGVARIIQEIMDRVEKISISGEDERENMALLLSGLLSINTRSIELADGGDGVREWFTLISGLLSQSLAEAYKPTSTISVSFVVAEKTPRV